MSETTPLRERVPAPGRVELPADRPDLKWRRITLADAPEIHALLRVAGIVDHPSYIIGLEEIERDLGRPEVDLAVDSLLAEDAGGRVVACGLVTLIPVQDVRVKSVFSGTVHPDRRREGIGTSLLSWQEARGLEQLATSEKPLPGWLTTFADERAEDALELFGRHEFALSRWWLELERDLAEPIAEAPLDPALRLATFSADLSDAARLARNDAFRDHWGSSAMPPREWESMIALPIVRPDLSFVALDGEGQVAGLVLSETNPEEWDQVGYSFGYVAYVAVRREFRGRGVAKSLISHTMRAYRDAGLAKAVLDVDSESPTGATGLYDALGFVPINRSVTILKEF